MTAETMTQKTAVFSFGSLSAREEPRSYNVDEPTRKLPLIAGRFAGREWDEDELQREYEQKKQKPVHSRIWVVVISILALAAALLLIGSLMGRARLVVLNQQAVETTQEIGMLRQEQNELRLRSAQTSILRAGNGPVSAVPAGEDTAVVLSVRRGHELQHMWNSLVDMLGESFH